MLRPAGTPSLTTCTVYGFSTADPRSIDRHLRAKWAELYDIDPERQEEKATAFMAKYVAHIQKG